MVPMIEICRELGVRGDFLEYHYTAGDIPKPSKFGWSRVWSQEEADQVRAFVAGHKKWSRIKNKETK